MAAIPHGNEHLPRPGPIGRTVRFVVGGFLIYFFVGILRQAPGFLARQSGWRLPGGDWWFAGLICLFALPRMLKSGFDLDWKRLFLALLALAAAAFIADRLAYGALWAWPLGLVVLLLILFVIGYGGLSFLAAGFVATPG